jgi:catechol 2,3-dioxygenase-like lactoylglutathione lyase family enzyme
MKDRGDEEHEMSNKTKTAITDVGAVGVPVTDQDRALEFYVGKLGFEIRLDVPMPGGGRWIMVAPPGATTSIALVAASDSIPAGVETGIRFMTADADADHAYFRASGVDADDVLRWPGVPPMFAFRDQEGNGLEIVQGA